MLRITCQKEITGSNYGEMYKNLKSLVESLNACIFNKLEPKTEGSSSGISASRSGDSTTNEPVGTFPVESVYPPVLAPGSNDLFLGLGDGIFPNRGSDIGGGMLVGPNDPTWFGGSTGYDFLVETWFHVVLILIQLAPWMCLVLALGVSLGTLQAVRPRWWCSTRSGTLPGA